MAASGCLSKFAPTSIETLIMTERRADRARREHAVSKSGAEKNGVRSIFSSRKLNLSPLFPTACDDRPLLTGDHRGQTGPPSGRKTVVCLLLPGQARYRRSTRSVWDLADSKWEPGVM